MVVQSPRAPPATSPGGGPLSPAAQQRAYMPDMPTGAHDAATELQIIRAYVQELAQHHNVLLQDTLQECGTWAAKHEAEHVENFR